MGDTPQVTQAFGSKPWPGSPPLIRALAVENGLACFANILGAVSFGGDGSLKRTMLGSIALEGVARSVDVRQRVGPIRWKGRIVSAGPDGQADRVLGVGEIPQGCFGLIRHACAHVRMIMSLPASIDDGLRIVSRKRGAR